MDVLQPFVPLGNSGLVPRGQRYESTLVCLSFKCLFNQAGSGCGALVRGKQTPPPEPAAPAAAPEGLANCFWVTRAESLKQHQISKTCRQNTSKHNSNEFGFLHWHICRSLIFRFALLSPFRRSHPTCCRHCVITLLCHTEKWMSRTKTERQNMWHKYQKQKHSESISNSSHQAQHSNPSKQLERPETKMNTALQALWIWTRAAISASAKHEYRL